MKLKKMMVVSLAGAMTVSMAACGGSKDSSNGSGSAKSDTKTIDQIELGKDYTDLKADLKVLTNRTDIVDTKAKEYAAEFNKLYPNIKINFEGITNYADDITTRLSTGDWGDVCKIPTTMDKNELPNYFVSYGSNETLSQNYIMLDNFSYDGQVYGIPSCGNIQGIVYNKKVFKEAGIKELPKTPDEFIEALKKIKKNTKAIPLYTNFAAGWTMGAWDGYIGGNATGDADYMNNKICHTKNPFAKQGDGSTGPYAVYNTLYRAVAEGLIEDDPTTTDWEGSKGMINNGKIGCMALGSWAVKQFQDAGKHASDIAYMPFPITVNGQQYLSAGPDYNFGINVKSSDDNKLASMIWVKWLTEKSNYAYNEGVIPIAKDAKWPEAFNDLKKMNLVIDNPAKEGEETLFNDINSDSEVGLNSDNKPDCDIVEAALKKSKTIDQIMDEWNQKWTNGQKSNNALSE